MPKKISQSSKREVRSHKQTATDFLKLVVAGQIGEAYRKYVDMQRKHHNPFFPAGSPALQLRAVTTMLPSLIGNY